MPRSSSKNTRRWPLWLVIVAAVIGWYFGKDTSQQTSQSPPERTTASRPAPARKPSRETPPSIPSDNSVAPVGNWEKPGTTFSDTVERVTDGDTVVLKRNGKVRLIGVDTPESKQPGGKEATAWVRSTLEGKAVQVETCAKQPKDRYGRMLAIIYYKDSRGRMVPVNREIVWRGYARVYSVRPCTVDDESWEADYESARARKRGLFGTIGYVPDAAAYRRKKRSGNTS